MSAVGPVALRDEICRWLDDQLRAAGVSVLAVDRSQVRPGLHLVVSRGAAARACGVIDCTPWQWRREGGPRLPLASRSVTWWYPGGARVRLTTPGIAPAAPRFRLAQALLQELPPLPAGIHEAPGWAIALTTAVEAGVGALSQDAALLAETRDASGGSPRARVVARKARLGPDVGTALDLVEPRHAPTHVPACARHRATRGVTQRFASRRPRPTLCRFAGLELVVPAGTFLPRREGERLVDAGVAHLVAHGVDAPRAIDVATGSGAVALALAEAAPGARVLATELLESVADVARRNVRRLGRADVVDVVVSNLLDTIPDAWHHDVDLVVANLPCVPPGAFDGASDAGRAGYVGHDDADGMGLHRRLLLDARGILSARGALCLQLRPEQVAILSEEAPRRGWRIARLDPGDTVSIAVLRPAGDDG